MPATTRDSTWALSASAGQRPGGSARRTAPLRAQLGGIVEPSGLDLRNDRFRFALIDTGAEANGRCAIVECQDPSTDAPQLKRRSEVERIVRVRRDSEIANVRLVVLANASPSEELSLDRKARRRDKNSLAPNEGPPKRIEREASTDGPCHEPDSANEHGTVVCTPRKNDAGTRISPTTQPQSHRPRNSVRKVFRLAGTVISSPSDVSLKDARGRAGATTVMVPFRLTGRSAAPGSAGRPLHRRVSCLPRFGSLLFSRLTLGVEPGAWRRGSVKHALDADVLIDVWPMDTLASSDQPEVRALGGRRVRESP